MTPEINHILYATDLSENARFAFRYAASLAHQYNAVITMLHVVEEANINIRSQLVSFIGETQWTALRETKMNEYKEAMWERVSNFCDEMKDEMDECPFLVEKILVREGNPVDEILRISTSRKCDMVVMGTHGYGMLAGALMGSVARRVVRRSQIPVLVIRLPEA